MTDKHTIGQVIRQIHSDSIAPVYFLMGEDACLQDFLIRTVSDQFLKKGGIRRFFSMDDDQESELFSELSSYSLFEDRNLFIVRQIRKFSQQSRQELKEYIQSPKKSNCLVLINEQFDRSNKFLLQLMESTAFVDTRPPFSRKFKEWVQYMARTKNIQTDDNAVELLMEMHGDSIANVVNELEKLAISVDEGKAITREVVEAVSSHQREFQVWQLVDALGKKDLKLSMRIFNSLVNSGIQIPLLTINLANLFHQILWKKMGSSPQRGYTGLNKILTSRLDSYSRGFSSEDVEGILAHLRKVDLLSKTTSQPVQAVLTPLIFEICEGIHAR